jgi:hypothetical protein
MDASKIQSQTHATSTSSSQPKSLGNIKTAIESPSDNEQVNSPKTSSNETVKLSDTSLKLSTSSPVKSSDRFASIQDNDQAQQAIKQLLADFQSNPSQAHDTHNNIFAGAVKSLLG